MNDDKSLKLKACIVPHGKEDYDKEKLHTECNMYPQIGIRVISNMATERRCLVLRADAVSAFLQTGPAVLMCILSRHTSQIIIVIRYGGCCI